MSKIPDGLLDVSNAPTPITPSGLLVENQNQMVMLVLDALRAPQAKHEELKILPHDPDEVFGLDDEVKNARGVVTNGKTRHEVSHEQYRFTVASVVGQLTRAKFYDIFMSRVWASKVTLEQQQPGAWAPIGVRFAIVSQARLYAERNPNVSEESYNMSLTSPDKDKSTPQLNIRALKNDERLLVHVAWWESTGTPPYDFLLNERNFKASPIAKYAETREIARMPTRNRLLRAEAEHTHLVYWNSAFRGDRELTAEQAAILGQGLVKGKATGEKRVKTP